MYATPTPRPHLPRAIARVLAATVTLASIALLAVALVSRDDNPPASVRNAANRARSSFDWNAP